jgi:hypothetical protein
MATRPPPPRQPVRPGARIPPPPPRLPEYIPIEQQAEPTQPGYWPDEPPPDNQWPDEPGEAEQLPNTMAAITTIVAEQRARSLEIQRLGPTAYMAQFDTRTAEDFNEPVEGISTTQVSEAELRR